MINRFRRAPYICALATRTAHPLRAETHPRNPKICARSDNLNTVSLYDAANELVTAKDNTGTTTYAYDANGNQRTKKVPAGGVTTNTWDYENRLTRVLLASGARNTFSYDAIGKRTRNDDSSGTSKFVWDVENILLETNSGDVTQVIYTLEPVIYGNLVSQHRGATTTFFHFDALGSTDRLTTSSPLKKSIVARSASE